ncbi:hypothetical protein KCU90_g57, partial [Aureobasidium melanogenum]
MSAPSTTSPLGEWIALRSVVLYEKPVSPLRLLTLADVGIGKDSFLPWKTRGLSFNTELPYQDPRLDLFWQSTSRPRLNSSHAMIFFWRSMHRIWNWLL